MKGIIHSTLGGSFLGFALGISNINLNTWQWWCIFMTAAVWYFTKPSEK